MIRCFVKEGGKSLISNFPTGGNRFKWSLQIMFDLSAWPYVIIPGVHYL